MAGVRGASTSTHVIENDEGHTTYEEIMGIPPAGDVGGGATALSSRLVGFREWLSKDAKVTVHPSLCIVNGEATDGTKNAPVLLFGPPPEVVRKNLAANKLGRCGMVDKTEDQALYDRTMGCQVRAAREIKKDEVLMTVPRTAMITPDVVATSDAGRAVLACCKAPSSTADSIEFWDVFENTTACERKYADNIGRNNGTQMLVKILQDRKKAEAAFNRVNAKLAEPMNGESNDTYELAAPGTISTRAPVLAFLIQQRFSNEVNPPVASEGNIESESDVSALPKARQLDLPPETPHTFGPYARTLPSSVAVPICWKRNELALLAGCILGIGALQDVTSRTALLSAEFISLVKAGLLQRFPEIFPPGVITWERWVWAAAVFDSRVLPASCYLNEGEENAVSQFKGKDSAIQSSPQVWDELGVLIPLQDMLNHETEAPQVTWEPNVPKTDSLNGEGESDGEELSHPPRAIVHKRVKKGSQLYATYGLKSNQYFITQYGFALVGNKDDDVKIGWALADAVGNIPAPSDYSPPAVKDKKEASDPAGDTTAAPKLGEGDMVYDSLDAEPINQWWTEDRLALLEKEALMSSNIIASLRSGKKLTAWAYGDGRYHPVFLSAAVIGTMPPSDVKRCLSKGSSAKASDGSSEGLALSKTHQEILRNYLQFFFCRKMEKLLQNLNNGLKDHFGVQLWTKVSDGGLQYNTEEDADADGAAYEGWQTFFDANAYATSMECENRYYAIGSDSCVLAMYDGHVRAVQTSIGGTLSQETFEKGVLQQLKDIGFVLLEGDAEMKDVAAANGVASSENLPDDKEKDTSKGNAGEQKEKQSNEAGKGGSKSGRRRNRRRNGGGGGGGDRPPAIKLHIGNLAYTTLPADLFEYFAGLYGRENILECHIPTERDSGRSRGFGFVTLPDVVAMRVLQSGRKHQISGRLLKVAESNSTGGRGGRGSGGPGSATSDRCATCGYRPKYCVCPGHGMPGHEGGSWHHYGDAGRPPPDYPDPYYGPRGRDDRRRGSYSRSPSYHRSGSRGGRSRDRDLNRDYDRDYDRDHYDRDYDRDYYDRDYREGGSRSYSRGGDRGSDRGRRDRDRSRERSRDRSRGRSRRSRSPGRPRSRDERRRSRSADRSRSHSGERSLRRERKGDDAEVRSPGIPPPSPVAPRGSGSGGGSERKRDSSKRSRSRSRSRGRSGKRRKSSKKDASRRHRSRSRSRSASPRAATG